MDDVARFAVSGLMAAQDVMLLLDADNGTAPTDAPPASDCPANDFKSAWFDDASKQWEFFTLFLIFGFLAAWARRARNQRAVMLGIAVEGLFALVYSVGALAMASIARRCTGDGAPGTSLVVTNVFLVLGRVGQVAAGFIAQQPNSQKKAGGAMMVSSFVYFFTWLTFMASIFNWNYFTAISLPVSGGLPPQMAPIGYAIVRSGLIALAGGIYFIQSEPSSEEDGVEMP